MVIKIRKQGDVRRLLGQAGTQTALVPIASLQREALCPREPPLTHGEPIKQTDTFNNIIINFLQFYCSYLVDIYFFDILHLGSDRLLWFSHQGTVCSIDISHCLYNLKLYFLFLCIVCIFIIIKFLFGSSIMFTANGQSCIRFLFNYWTPLLISSICIFYLILFTNFILILSVG